MKEILKSKSHKRLLKDIERASEARDKKLERGRISLPSGEGILSIIVSHAPDYVSRISPEGQRKAFLEEAEKIREERAGDHDQILIRRRAVPIDMKLDFADERVTDIVLIGHGSLSSMWAEGGKNFDWRMAAKSTDRLKTGKIEQRMCGNLPSKKEVIDGQVKEILPHQYTVPLGTFAVTSLDNVIAATGKKIPDICPPDELFEPVFADNGSPIDLIRELNDKFMHEPTVIVPDERTTAGL